MLPPTKEMRVGILSFNGYRGLIWSGEKVLEIMVMAVQHCEYT